MRKRAAFREMEFGLGLWDRWVNIRNEFRKNQTRSGTCGVRRGPCEASSDRRIFLFRGDQ